MPTIDDLSQKFEKCKETLQSAQTALADSKHAEAETLFFEAFKQVQQLLGADSVEMAACLQGLADTYLEQKKYLEAKPVLMQLTALEAKLEDVEPETQITNLFKLAKSYDRLQEFDECEAVLERSQGLAEDCLGLGHPLVTNMLEAYATLLRKTRKQPKKLQELEQRARYSRQKFSNIEQMQKNILEGAKTKGKPKSKEMPKPEYNYDESLFNIVEKGPPKYNATLIARIMVFLPLILPALLVLIAIGSALFEAIVPGAKTSFSVVAGKSFVTADNLKSFKFNPSGTTDVSIAGIKTKPPYKVLGQAWTEVLMSFGDTRRQIWLKIEGDGLVDDFNVPLMIKPPPKKDEDGKLIEQKEPDIALTKEVMKKVGTLHPDLIVVCRKHHRQIKHGYTHILLAYVLLIPIVYGFKCLEQQYLTESGSTDYFVIESKNTHMMYSWAIFGLFIFIFIAYFTFGMVVAYS